MDTIKNVFRSNYTELMDRFNDISSRIAKCDPLVEQVKGKDIVILLGNTKAGKSSLCHFIIGNPLIAAKVKRSRTFGISAVHGYEGPAIGERITAETTVPTVWTPARITEVLVDAPGFEDNRGEAQDIANCFYIKRMIVNAKSVKFMLISDINDIISHNISSFITFVDKVYAMLPILEDLQHGVCLVFTKDDRHSTIDEMREYLNDIYTEDRLCIKRSVLMSFISNKSTIALFRAPDHVGPIDENIGMDIIDAVKKLSAIPCNSLPVITPAVSDRSRVFLLFAEKQLSENPMFFTIMQAIPKEFETKVKVGILRDRTTTEKSKEELQELRNCVKAAKESVENDASLLNILDALMQLSSRHLREQMEHGDLKTSLQFIEFINDTLCRPGNAIFRLQFNMLIDRIEVAIDSSYAKVQEALEEITREEYESEISRLSEKLNERTQQYEKEVTKLKDELDAMRKKDEENSSSCIIL